MQTGLKRSFHVQPEGGQPRGVPDPSELYTTKAACTGGIESVRKNASVDTNFTRKVAKDGSDYFVLVASNHQTIGKERDLLVGRGHGKRHRLCKGERAERDRQRPLLLGLVHTE